MQAQKLSHQRYLSRPDFVKPVSESRIEIVLSFNRLRAEVEPYLKVLSPYGYDLLHLVGFAVYALGEQQKSLTYQELHERMKDTSFTYLAHELLSVNPYIGRDRDEFQRIVGTTHGAIEIIIRVIRGLLLNATRNPHTSKVLLERFLGTNAAVLSVEVYEAPYGPDPRFAAPVF